MSLLCFYTWLMTSTSLLHDVHAVMHLLGCTIGECFHHWARVKPKGSRRHALKCSAHCILLTVWVHSFIWLLCCVVSVAYDEVGDHCSFACMKSIIINPICMCYKSYHARGKHGKVKFFFSDSSLEPESICKMVWSVSIVLLALLW